MTRIFSDAQKTYSVALRFIPANSNRTIRLIENNPNRIKASYNLLKQPLWVNGFVEELYCFSSIRSIPEVGIPPISQEDDEYIRLQKTLNYEWATARFELTLFAGNSRGLICELGRVALKNSQGYPYRRHRLIDLLTDNTSYLLGENDFIACSLNTFGLPLGANDTIAITGNWKQEIILVPEQQLISNVINVAGTNESSSPSPTPTPTPTPTPITTTTNATFQSFAYIVQANPKRTSLSIRWTNGAAGIIYKSDAPNNPSTTISFMTTTTPTGFFDAYTGRVGAMVGPGDPACTVQITEVSNP